MKSRIGIYQPCYKPALIERLDPGFIMLDWMSNPAPALRELALHQHIADEKIYTQHQLTGLLSPKFYSKTRLDSRQVYDWISDNPGRDIYLIGGLPYVPYANYNSLERSRIVSHPAFERWARSVANEIGLEIPAKPSTSDQRQFLWLQLLDRVAGVLGGVEQRRYWTAIRIDQAPKHDR